MIAAHRRRIEKTDREKIFLISHLDDFPQGSPVDSISAEINAKVEDFLTRDAALFSTLGGKLQVREVKGDTRDFLIANLCDIATSAVAIGDETVPGIIAKYNFQSPRDEQELIETAEAWFAETETHENLFITHGLDADFRNNLLNAKNDFQKALDAVFNSSQGNIGAFDELETLMFDIMNLTRRRSALVNLKYKNNPSKLASWLIASHLEPPPKMKISIFMQMI